MTVSIRCMLFLETCAELSMGKKIVSAELREGATFSELLMQLEQYIGAEPAREIYDPRKGPYQPPVRAGINGVLVQSLPEGMDTRLHQGDSVVFFPVIVGG